MVVSCPLKNGYRVTSESSGSQEAAKCVGETLRVPRMQFTGHMVVGDQQHKPFARYSEPEPPLESKSSWIYRPMC